LISSRDIARLSLFTALALTLYTLESLLPRPLPWLRLGLSNALVLAVVLTYGLRLGLVVSVSRTLLGSLLIGSFFGPGFILSISAGVVSCVVMGTASLLGRRTLGTTGISVFGALAHNFTQLGLAYLLFIRRLEIFMLVPMFLLLSVATGVVTGIAAHFLYQRASSVYAAVG